MADVSWLARLCDAGVEGVECAGLGLAPAERVWPLDAVVGGLAAAAGWPPCGWLSTVAPIATSRAGARPAAAARGPRVAGKGARGDRSPLGAAPAGARSGPGSRSD